MLAIIYLFAPIPASFVFVVSPILQSNYAHKEVFDQLAEHIIASKSTYSCMSINNVLFSYSHLGLKNSEIFLAFEEEAIKESASFKDYELAGK